MRKIVDLVVLENYRIRLRFDDGAEGVADFSGKVRTGVFSAWQDYNFFRSVRIGDCGELVWNDQIDFCPDAIWRQVTGGRTQPSANPSTAYA
jgi:hypothetical protein